MTGVPGTLANPTQPPSTSPLSPLGRDARPPPTLGPPLYLLPNHASANAIAFPTYQSPDHARYYAPSIRIPTQVTPSTPYMQQSQSPMTPYPPLWPPPSPSQMSGFGSFPISPRLPFADSPPLPGTHEPWAFVNQYFPITHAISNLQNSRLGLQPTNYPLRQRGAPHFHASDADIRVPGHDYVIHHSFPTPPRPFVVVPSRVKASKEKQIPLKSSPRKPRQNRFAIWIGNLPSHTNLMGLVHHVCRETQDLQSLFLIPKSNCAFANYLDEASCNAAQQKLNDTKFHSARLVTRPRKGALERGANIACQEDENEKAGSGDEDATAQKPPKGSSDNLQIFRKDRFFIMKSLTMQDLQLSTQVGIWATQAHNEDTLNQAFENSENVYLIFSANKSGEYFGYARMIAPIQDDPSLNVQFSPVGTAEDDTESLPAIPIPGNGLVPPGVIVEDSSRGTMFWEADSTEPDSLGQLPSSINDTMKDDATATVKEDAAKVWGKPFRIMWLSTTRVPFHRTKGLLNPWNVNREVKIARDGTQIEPTTGHRLLTLFQPSR